MSRAMLYLAQLKLDALVPTDQSASGTLSWTGPIRGNATGIGDQVLWRCFAAT